MVVESFKPLEAKSIIPHRHSMCLVDQLLSFEAPGTGRIRLKVKENAVYMENNRFQNEWCIEIMAQAVACVFSYDSCQTHKNLDIGFLLSIDEFKLTKGKDETIVPGDEIFIDVTLNHDLFPIRKYSSYMLHNQKKYAAAAMKFYAQTKSEILNK